MPRGVDGPDRRLGAAPRRPDHDPLARRCPPDGPRGLTGQQRRAAACDGSWIRGRARTLWCHILPGVLGPLTRHALLRIPGIALALAALGFLGLGPQPPTPDWGLVLSEGMPYVERAPWTAFGPCLSLVALSVLTVTASALRRSR
ncbi:ABC transporter permease subunit [Micromonospora sp. NPDC047465]|uniref:ABC transporter permease subunit n=1 Tax=Micromonospora sp. NPDC047465 TaxID=3154813 RepID=UPI0033D8F438